MLQGNYRTMFRGVGTDFRDLREYEPGDDIRHIDWNVTARMDTPFVRQFSEDRELTAWLLLDRSPSMGFGPIQRPKELVLCELATTFARLLTRGGNRVGAILFDNEVEGTLPPRSSRNQVLALARNLHAAAGVARDDHRPDRTARVGERSDQAALARRPHVRLHHGTGLGAAAAAADRAARGRRDPAPRPAASTSCPTPGVIVVEDAETGEQLTVDSSDDEFRHRLRSRVRSARRSCALRPSAPGVDIYEVSTEDDLVTALVRIIELRKRGGADVARLAVDAALPRSSCPLVVFFYWRATPPARAPLGPARLRGARADRRAAAAPAGGATSPSRSSPPASRSPPSRWRDRR